VTPPRGWLFSYKNLLMQPGARLGSSYPVFWPSEDSCTSASRSSNVGGTRSEENVQGCRYAVAKSPFVSSPNRKRSASFGKITVFCSASLASPIASGALMPGIPVPRSG
jgi:hypothetical protein